MEGLDHPSSSNSPGIVKRCLLSDSAIIYSTKLKINLGGPENTVVCGCRLQ